MSLSSITRMLAEDLDHFSFEFDTYEYKDRVENREENVLDTAAQLLDGNISGIRNYLVEFVEESEDPETVQAAQSLIDRLNDYADALAKKPSLESQIISASERSSASSDACEKKQEPER